MRILLVWVTAIALIFMVSLGWYVSLPAVIGISRALNNTYYDNPNGRNVATAVEYASFAWGPVINLFILLWAVISSQKRDVESEVYG